MTGAIAIVVFVVALVACVLIHELGHLLTAKAFGMRADRYFVGFGPTLFSTRRGETEYGLKAFPLGGFVSIRGMTPLDERRLPVVDEVFAADALAADRDRSATTAGAAVATQPNIPAATFERLEGALRERGTQPELVDRIVRRMRGAVGAGSTAGDGRRALTEVLHTEVGESERHGDLAHRLLLGDQGRFYHDRPIWQRAVTIFTGPATHLVLAFLVLLGAYTFVALPTGEPTTEVAAVVADTPAADAGIAPGDRLLAVGGTSSDDYLALRDAIRARPGLATILSIERDGARLELEIVPRTEIDPETGERFGFAGFAPVATSERRGFTDAVRRASM
ncbi:MAG: site-2 protease family protein, partial [Actinomycetota bacterium]